MPSTESTGLLAAEGKRINRELDYILQQGNLVDEVPTRLHSRETDAGGAPELHPAFLRYVDQGVCKCGRPAVCDPNCRFLKDGVLGHLRTCEPACRDTTRFRASKHKNHPQRMKRALRAIRDLNPKAYDFCFLVIARGYTFEQAADKINADNSRRGIPERTSAEFAVLWVSGASMLAGTY